MKTVKHRLEFFPIDLHIAFTPKDIKRVYKKFDNYDHPDKTYAGSVSRAYGDDGTMSLLVFINVKNHRKFYDLLNTIQHESYHVYAALIEHLQMDPDEETSAYLICGISEIIYRAVAKHSDTSYELPVS